MSRDLIDHLRENAEMFWPERLTLREQETSIIPRMVESQKMFLDILVGAGETPIAWKNLLLAAPKLPGNLFLKHLMVLADVGGERLESFRSKLENFFPAGKMTFWWKGYNHSYEFQSLAKDKTWKNAKLFVDGKGLLESIEFQPIHEDVCMLILHGGAAIDPGLPEDLISHCMLGTLLGQKEELETFLVQRYLHVSRITGGATANTMGQLCQQDVHERLKNRLQEWDFNSRTITGVSQNAGRTDMAFDIVSRSPNGVCCAVEVSFQVTTNSTIERKAGQAATRQKLLHAHGHRIAYVIDGAGNFRRNTALNTICTHSDCTVTFCDAELDRLADFLRSLEKDTS